MSRIGPRHLPEAVTILLVDDDQVDVMAVKRALKELGIPNPLVVAEDGIEAFEHMRGENGRRRLETPYLVCLDLNMPRMNGQEFLDELRGDDTLHSALVFVMTTSAADEDRARVFARNVAGYIMKQRFGESLVQAVGLLERYWRVAEFPP